MATSFAAYLYTETRLNLDESHPGSTIELTLNRSNPKRTIIGSSAAVDEASFARDNLANDASVFFRSRSRPLRSFLWRLLDERKVLELQCVDLTQQLGEDKESIITLRLRFDHAVRPFCIVFADHDTKDALVIFAITTDGQFFTITLPQDCFVQPKVTEALPADWCRNSSPASLRLRKPYRMTAIDSKRILIALVDGSLLKLERPEPTSSWNETYYSISSWSMLPRALARLKGDSFIQFGDTELDTSTIASVALSPDEQHIITVCLNHTLRIWNVQTGKVVMETDLLEPDDRNSPQQQHKYLVAPSQRQLLQVLDVPGREGDQYYIVTFSPKQQSFSFWAVLDAESGSDGVRRLQTSIEFVLPMDQLMQSSAWNLEEFQFVPNRGWTKTVLWLRSRSGPTSKAFSITFDLFDNDGSLSSTWASSWTCVSPGLQSVDYLSSKVPAGLSKVKNSPENTNPNDEWITFLFYPSRFTTSTLQTALHVYVRGTSINSNSKATANIGKGTLSALIVSAVSRKANFHQIGVDYDQRQQKVFEEWQIFYGLVQDLHKRRSLIVAFTFDVEEQLPWLVAADSVSPLRTCNDLELSRYHRSDESESVIDEQLSKHLKTSYETMDLLHVANLFSDLFPASSINHFKELITTESLSSPSHSVEDRIANLRSQASLGTQIGDEEWSKLFDAMDEVGGFDVLDAANFHGVLDLLNPSSKGKQFTERLVRYGTKAVVRTAEENVSLHLTILLDLLLLVMFVETEIDPSELESGMQTTWRGQDLYFVLLQHFKEQAVLQFLLQTTRVERIRLHRPKSDASSASMAGSSNKASDDATSYNVTLLESLFIGDWSSLRAPADLEMPNLITSLAQSWMASLNVTGEFEELTSHVFADLIKHSDKAIAVKFLPYLPRTAWTTYLEGRLWLCRDALAQAADAFIEAGFPISRLTSAHLAALNSAQLVRPDEINLISHSLAGYFEHVLNLFDHLKSPKHVVQFAQLALQQQALSTDSSHTRKTPRKSHHSATSADSTSNLLSRLYHAAEASSQYEIAYSALTRLPHPLRKACLQSFVNSLMVTRRANRLLSYPLIRLSREVDSVLTQRTQTMPLSTDTRDHSRNYETLYALRIKVGDFRGAAQCLWDYAAALQDGTDQTALDPRNLLLNEVYLMLMNALACCGKQDAWVLDSSTSAAGGKRRVVYLDEIRTQYQTLMAQASDLADGKFAFVNDDSMEIDLPA